MTEEEYDKIKEMGMLWELFPEATGSFKQDTITSGGCFCTGKCMEEGEECPNMKEEKKD